MVDSRRPRLDEALKDMFCGKVRWRATIDQACSYNSHKTMNNDEHTRPAEAASKQPMNRIGPNGVILGPDGKPCKVEHFHFDAFFR